MMPMHRDQSKSEDQDGDNEANKEQWDGPEIDLFEMFGNIEIRVRVKQSRRPLLCFYDPRHRLGRNFEEPIPSSARPVE